MSSRKKAALAVVPGDIVLLGRGWIGEAAEHPCRVVDKWRRLVRHVGQYKVRLEGVDIFTGQKCEVVYFMKYRDVVVPTIKEITVLLLYIEPDGSLIATNSSGETVTDLTTPSDSLRQELTRAHEAGELLCLFVKCYMGRKVVFSYVGENEHFLAQPTE